MRQRAIRSSVLFVLASFVVLIALVSSSPPLAVIAATTIVVIGIAFNHRHFRCPECDTSMFRDGKAYTAWPVKECSKCHCDLRGIA